MGVAILFIRNKVRSIERLADAAEADDTEAALREAEPGADIAERMARAGFGPIATEIAPLRHYNSAEEFHQDYLVKHPNGYTCHYPRAGWKLPRREIG